VTARPRLLDLFSGAGGAAVGYHRAGFDVVGVDCVPQPRYPFPFVQADALEYLARHGREYDAIHASPPCQHYSACARMPGRSLQDYPDLVGLTLAALERSGMPWVLENVPGAPCHGIVLCGQMFGLAVYRHRKFDSNVLLLQPTHTQHRHRITKQRMGRWLTLEASRVITVAGHCYPLADGKRAMGIDWMQKDELSEAIPPAYTHYLGRQLRLILD
jgi:DNA (cytosine-5)-methyltransferase 1